MIKLIDDELLHKLHELVAIHSLENQKSLFELKHTIELFYEKFLEALE